MKLMEHIAHTLKYYREKSGLTQEILSIRSGVSVTLISCLESGKRKNVTLQTLIKLSHTLNIHMFDLLQ